MEVVYFGGYWSTNIGNAFYDKGIIYALSNFTERKSSFIQDIPNYNSPLQPIAQKYNIDIFKKDPFLKLTYQYLNNLKDKIIIFSGPLLSEYFVHHISPILIDLKTRGCEIGLLSCGGAKYSEKEAFAVKNCLKKINPIIFSSRDSWTYKQYFDVCQNSYDGICFAFYAKDYYKNARLIQDKYIVFNFDLGRDYEICKNSLIDNSGRFLYNSAKKNKSFFEGFKDKLYNHKIIRTKHNFVTTRPNIFDTLKRNKIKSDTPDIFLNIYKYANCTFSERVHACVAALAFGKPAILFSDTPRSKIFERLGLKNITKSITTLDMSRIKDEKERLKEFIKKNL